MDSLEWSDPEFLEKVRVLTFSGAAYQFQIAGPAAAELIPIINRGELEASLARLVAREAVRPLVMVCWCAKAAGRSINIHVDASVLQVEIGGGTRYVSPPPDDGLD